GIAEPYACFCGLATSFIDSCRLLAVSCGWAREERAMDEFRILATCVLGLGFSHKGFQAGLKYEPHLVACDSGSSDFGPYFLGSGQLQKPPSALERELAS